MRGEENLKFFLRCFVYFSIGVAVFQEVTRFNAPPDQQQPQQPQQPINNTPHSPQNQPQKSPEPVRLQPPSEKNEHFGETVVVLVQFCKS